MKRLLPAIALVIFGAADGFSQPWYNAYEDGIAAARKENWQVVVQKMTEAIAGSPNEGRIRPYGNVFVEYHPYYYRGIAYLNLGEFEKAVSDLKKAKGPGVLQLGTVDSFRDRAETKLAQAQAPQPTQPPPTTTAVATTTTRPEQPVTPAVDPAVRRSAEQMLAQAQASRDEAQKAKANTFAAGPFSQGVARFNDALNRSTTADSTADWLAVQTAADQAKRSFDAAITMAQTAIAEQQTAPERAADTAVAPARERVKDALAAYFDGDFRTAERRLNTLVSNDQKNNAVLWAFLGAARYYSWYLDGAENEASRKRAADAFRTARRLRPKLQLDESYFSSKVRKFYSNLPG